jgi:hypothetical protein
MRGVRAEHAKLVRIALPGTGWPAETPPDEPSRMLRDRYGAPVGGMECVPQWLTANVRPGGAPPEDESLNLNLARLVRSCHGRPLRRPVTRPEQAMPCPRPHWRDRAPPHPAWQPPGTRLRLQWNHASVRADVLDFPERMAVTAVAPVACRGLRRRFGAARVPVFLRPGRAGLHPEAAQLGSLAQAPLELGEAGEGGQGRDVAPEPDGILGPGEPADHRAGATRRGIDARSAQGPMDTRSSCQGGPERAVVRVREVGLGLRYRWRQ